MVHSNIVKSMNEASRSTTVAAEPTHSETKDISSKATQEGGQLKELIKDGPIAFCAHIREDPLSQVARSFTKQTAYCQILTQTDVCNLWNEIEEAHQSGGDQVSELGHQLFETLMKHFQMVGIRLIVNRLERPDQHILDTLRYQAEKRLGHMKISYLDTDDRDWFNVHSMTGIERWVNKLPETWIGKRLLAPFVIDDEDDDNQTAEEEARNARAKFVQYSRRALENLGIVLENCAIALFLGFPIIMQSTSLVSPVGQAVVNIALLLIANLFLQATMRDAKIILALIIAFASALTANSRGP